MSQQRSKEVMRRYLTEVVAQGRLELIDELAAEDMVDHTQTTRRRSVVNRSADIATHKV